jgi:hypothetical protein
MVLPRIPISFPGVHGVKANVDSRKELNPFVVIVVVGLSSSPVPPEKQL